MSAIMTVVSKFGQLTTDLTRSSQLEDVVCQKIFGIAIGFVGSVSGLIAFAAWKGSCYDVIPDEATFNGVTVTFDKKFGPGYICIWIVTVLGLPDMVFHALTPVPEERSIPGFRNKNDNKIADSTVQAGAADTTAAV